MIAPSGCMSAASTREPIVYTATVCDLLRHRDAFDNKTIRIHATFVGGLLEGAGIIDARCNELGGIAVVNDEASGIAEHLVALAKAMQRARVTSTKNVTRTVKAHLVGTFRAGSKATGGATLVLRDASDMHVVVWTPVMVPLPQPR